MVSGIRLHQIWVTVLKSVRYSSPSPLWYLTATDTFVFLTMWSFLICHLMESSLFTLSFFTKCYNIFPKLVRGVFIEPSNWVHLPIAQQAKLMLWLRNQADRGSKAQASSQGTYWHNFQAPLGFRSKRSNSLKLRLRGVYWACVQVPSWFAVLMALLQLVGDSLFFSDSWLCQKVPCAGSRYILPVAWGFLKRNSSRQDWTSNCYLYQK